MNVEFHYYILKYIALNSGFSQKDSEVLAYSSQYVQNNYKESDWYKFQTACKDYQKEATNLLRKTLVQIDIHNW